MQPPRFRAEPGDTVLLVVGIMLNAIYGAQFSGMLFPRGSVLGMIASVQLAIAGITLAFASLVYGVFRRGPRVITRGPRAA